MLTVSKASSQSEKAARRILDGINPDFASQPVPISSTTQKTAGELLVLASRQPVSVDSVQIIRGIKSKVAAQLKAARRPLDNAELVAEWLNKAADFLLDGDRLPPAPDGVPPHIIDNVKALKTFARAGLVSAGEIAGKLNRAASTALEDILAAKKSYQRFYSAGSVACLKQASKYADLCDRPEMASGLNKRWAVAASRHRSQFGEDLHRAKSKAKSNSGKVVKKVSRTKPTVIRKVG